MVSFLFDFVLDMLYNVFEIFIGGVFMADKVRDRPRTTLRLAQKDMERLQYWSERAGCSISDFVVLMLDQYVDIYNGNYQLPTLEVQRLNQLVDLTTVLSRNVQSLESIVVSGFDSLLSITKGDNYLLEDEDGEIGG